MAGQASSERSGEHSGSPPSELWERRKYAQRVEHGDDDRYLLIPERAWRGLVVPRTFAEVGFHTVGEVAMVEGATG